RAVEVRDRQVLATVAVEIADRQGGRQLPSRVELVGILKGSVAPAEEDRDGRTEPAEDGGDGAQVVDGDVRHRQVLLAVSVEITHGDRQRHAAALREE